MKPISNSGSWYERFHQFMDELVHRMHLKSILLLQYSLAIVFFWFGILKPLGHSPAEHLVAQTAFWFDAYWFVPFLGYWEMTIGVMMLFPRTLRYALILLFMQIPCTFLPLVLVPDLAFDHGIWDLTLEGQYIIKNLILIAAAIAVTGSLDKTVEITTVEGK